MYFRGCFNFFLVYVWRVRDLGFLWGQWENIKMLQGFRRDFGFGKGDRIVWEYYNLK